MESKLKAFFAEEELEWRVQSCGTNEDKDTGELKPWVRVLCYIQARAIQNRLDDVLGWENWKDEYRVEGKDILCRLSLRLGSEWIAKENGASETDIEAFKGGISGAFKRVASSGFGIGRYLYDLPSSFAVCGSKKQKGWNTAKKDGKNIYWETPKMPARLLPDFALFEIMSVNLKNAKTEDAFGEMWSKVKARKKDLTEQEFKDLDIIASEERKKWVNGANEEV